MIHSIQIGELHDVEERLKLYRGHLDTWKPELERRPWFARVFQSRDAKSEVRFARAQIDEQEKRKQGLLDQVTALEARIRNNEKKMVDLKEEHDRQIATKFGSSP